MIPFQVLNQAGSSLSFNMMKFGFLFALFPNQYKQRSIVHTTHGAMLGWRVREATSLLSWIISMPNMACTPGRKKIGQVNQNNFLSHKIYPLVPYFFQLELLLHLP